MTSSPPEDLTGTGASRRIIGPDREAPFRDDQDVGRTSVRHFRVGLKPDPQDKSGSIQPPSAGLSDVRLHDLHHGFAARQTNVSISPRGLRGVFWLSVLCR